jgi:hypothetical protein
LVPREHSGVQNLGAAAVYILLPIGLLAGGFRLPGAGHAKQRVLLTKIRERRVLLLLGGHSAETHGQQIRGSFGKRTDDYDVNIEFQGFVVGIPRAKE